jgi:hypothetical protein
VIVVAIGDIDPEDAYDATDSPARRLEVLRLVVTDLIKQRRSEQRTVRRRWALRGLDRIAREHPSEVDLFEVENLRGWLEANG